MARWLSIALAMLGTATLVGCGSSSSPTSAGARTAATVLKPAGRLPSPSAKMVCATEAQASIAQSLGLQPTAVTTPTWVDHLYTCKYEYADGSIALSVKELDNAAQTTGYFNQLGVLLGKRSDRIALGQGTFITTNGSLVVRKDWKVMLVDVSQLPTQFGVPPQAPRDVALSIAAIILTCWSGA